MSKEEKQELLDRCDLEGEQNLEKIKIDTGFSQPLKNFRVEHESGFLVFEGDIILDNQKDVTEKGNIIINKFKWPSYEIPYAYDPDLDLEHNSRSWYKTIEAAVKRINEQTNVSLKRLEGSTDGVNHIYFNKGNGVGRKSPGEKRHFWLRTPSVNPMRS